MPYSARATPSLEAIVFGGEQLGMTTHNTREEGNNQEEEEASRVNRKVEVSP
jgi:hypothetical protein